MNQVQTWESVYQGHLAKWRKLENACMCLRFSVHELGRPPLSWWPFQWDGTAGSALKEPPTSRSLSRTWPSLPAGWLCGADQPWSEHVFVNSADCEEEASLVNVRQGAGEHNSDVIHPSSALTLFCCDTESCYKHRSWWLLIPSACVSPYSWCFIWRNGRI